MIATMVYMFPRGLEPGGVFVIEDLVTSYSQRQNTPGSRTAMHFIQDLVIMMQAENERDPSSTVRGPPFDLKRAAEFVVHLQSLICDREICSFKKKQKGKPEIPLLREYEQLHGPTATTYRGAAIPKDGSSYTLIVMDASAPDALLTLETLLMHHLSPGGTLVLKNIIAEPHMDTQDLTKLLSNVLNWFRLFHARNYPWMHLWIYPQAVKYVPSIRWIRTIECERHVCAIRKRWKVAVWKDEQYRIARKLKKASYIF